MRTTTSGTSSQQAHVHPGTPLDVVPFFPTGIAIAFAYARLHSHDLASSHHWSSKPEGNRITMGLQEVARRVLLGHWIVILAFVATGIGGVGAYHFIQAPTYTASTRLVLDAPPPTSGTEAQALADSAKAIVTSPSHVEKALTAAGIVRDPLVVIQNITLVPLGTSGVLLLSVQDHDASASAAIANALAKDLIQTRLAVSVASQRAALDDRIAAANKAIDDLDQQVATLDAQLEALQVDPS